METFMKKSALIVLFAGMLALLSVTAVHAATVPGCNKEVHDAQKNQADAMRVRDKAYSREIIKRNDPALGMTCFDQAMGITGRLGGIFSDVFTPSLASIANTNVFSGADTATSLINMFTKGGTGNLLINNLNNVITPTLNEFLNDFTGTLSQILGTTIGNFLNTIVGSINTALSAINTYVGTITGTISSIVTFINNIQTIANQLSIALPQAVIIAITTTLKAIQSALNAAMSALMAAVNAAISAIMSGVMALINSLTNIACDRIADLWADGNPTGGAESVEGNGIEFDTPYYTYDDLLAGSPAGAGPDLLDELGNTFNAGVLSAALSDLTSKLNAPCNIKSWKTPPIFPPASTTSAIIGLMADPCP